MHRKCEGTTAYKDFEKPVTKPKGQKAPDFNHGDECPIVVSDTLYIRIYVSTTIVILMEYEHDHSKTY